MNRKEQHIQQACVKWFAYQYPHLKGLLCCNLNNSKDKRTGQINKSMGVIPGRSDMAFYYNAKALMIEIKIDKAYQTADQKIWQSTIEEQGFKYIIIRNTDKFLSAINEFIKKNNLLN